MDLGAAGPTSSSRSGAKKAEEASSRRPGWRNMEKGSGDPSRKAPDMEKKKRRSRRKTRLMTVKGGSDLKNENTSSRSQESTPAQTQRVGGDAVMVSAETQTRRLRGTSRSTQTPSVCHSNQETQTDLDLLKQDQETLEQEAEAPREKLRKRDDQAANTETTENPDPSPGKSIGEAQSTEGSQSEKGSQSTEGGQSAEGGQSVGEVQSTEGGQSVGEVQSTEGSQSTEGGQSVGEVQSTEGSQSTEGGQSEKGSQSTEGGQSVGEVQSTEGGQSEKGSQSVGEVHSAEGGQSAEGSQSTEGGQSTEAGQSAEGSQSVGEVQSAEGSQSTEGGQSAEGGQSEKGSQSTEAGQSAEGGQSVGEVQSAEGSRSTEGGRSTGDSATPQITDQTHTKLKSYASAVSAGGGAKVQTATETSGDADRRRRDRSPVRPPDAPIFTFHIHAILDRKFRFDRENDQLLLCDDGGCLPFQLTHFVGLRQGGYLLEASVSVDEKVLQRGSLMRYWYEVKQRNKMISGSAWRHVLIPPNQNIKELHLYEGFIPRQEQNFLQSGLQWMGLRKPRGEQISESWQTSAADLMSRIFQGWIPSEPQSTERLCDRLMDFHSTLGSAHLRISFLDNSRPPVVNTSELLSQTLLQILRGEVNTKFPGSWSSSGPLVLGLSVFMVARRTEVDLGLSGWTNLCTLLSSEKAREQKSLDELLSTLKNPQHTVTGVMNLCAQQAVAELVLLVPLLLTLRQPGADAGKLGPAVEEENWSGLENVFFRGFREKVQSHTDKRRRIMALIQTQASQLSQVSQVSQASQVSPAADSSLLRLSWCSLVALEDLPELSDLMGVPAEQLIQGLMYRLRNCDGLRDQDSMKESVKKALEHVLLKVDIEKDRMMESVNMKPVFLSAVSIVRSTCRMVRLVPRYQTVVLSYRLLLRLAEILEAKLKTESSEDESLKLSEELKITQTKISQWRDELLHKPLLSPSKPLSYPKEIQMWDALLKEESSLAGVSSRWSESLMKDLKKRIHKAGEEDQVRLCCLDSSLSQIRQSHEVVQTCFYESCQSAIRTVCQRGQEGALLRTLRAQVKELPELVTSAVVVHSDARFRGNAVLQLLDPQSAINQLLSQGDWKLIRVDEAAVLVVHRAVAALQALLDSLLRGNVHLGDLRTCLNHQKQFKTLHLQHQRNADGKCVRVDADAVLAQREKDLNAFLMRKQQMDTLIKMMAKVTESLTVPEMVHLEQQHGTDLQTVSLNKLVLVQSFGADGSLGKIGPPQILWYNISLKALKMAADMHRLHRSSLVLSSWVQRAEALAAAKRSGPGPVPVALAQVCDNIWQPLLTDFCRIAVSIAEADISLVQLDQLLLDCGDEGNGELVRAELNLMSETLRETGWSGSEPDWVQLRLGQIQEYRELHQAAAAANAILKLAQKMELSGNFTEIYTLSQLEEESFKQRPLASLTEDLFLAREQLSSVSKPNTECLQEFLRSHSLVCWVKENLKNMSDVKVYVDLASISAGENDSEIDQVACFHDAVTGYAPLLYSLSPHSGFHELMTRARQVWDAQSRDEKLPDKLRESTRLLSWLKALKETHGSVEQSSLSLASAINAHGVYFVGWSETNTQKRCLQNMIHVTVRHGREERRYKLEELLELQNKLMLMSSKGEHGREQVTRFTQVFEGVQRLGSILLQMQTSGNMLFRDWNAAVQSCSQQQPSITITFSSLMGKQMFYYGEVTEQLQALTNSMETCKTGWHSFISEMRSSFSLLNHYTSEQLVHLCRWIHQVCQGHTTVPAQLWHLLFPIMPQCTLADIREAYDNIDFVTSECDEEEEVELEDVDEQGFDSTARSSGEHMGKDLMEFSSEDEEDEMKGEAEDVSMSSEDSLESLWRKFRENMSHFLHESLDISYLAHVLSSLSEMNEQRVIRKFPPILQEGKPNLVLCPGAEVFTTVLSFYMESPEQPLPSSDEILVCTEETTEEQVEIFLRRALCRDCGQSQRRIYSLVNPGLLGYDVSVALGELFEGLERSAGQCYRLVIVSPVVHQHRYVPSFFSSGKVQAGVSLRADSGGKYLRYHFTQTTTVTQVSPQQLSVCMVSSARPAVGKSLYVARLFQKLRQKCPQAEHITVRLIEPSVDIDSLIKNLSEKLAHVRDQDPVLLHIDTAGVRSGLEELLFNLLILGCLSDSHGLLWRRKAAQLITVEVLRTNTAAQIDTKQMRPGLLDILPTILCRAPKELTQLLDSRGMLKKQTFDPLMDEQEFCSEGIQRPYQYLKRHNNNQNLDHFNYAEGSRIGNYIDCVNHFLVYCGMKDPSWAELKNFSWFLNVQLKDCERSIFCDPDFLADQLPGFKSFIVKFMILMARDFASPSLNTSDESPVLNIENHEEDDLLARLTIRKHWENESHPYIFFNADRFSMSFLGFNVKKSQRQNTLNAVDPQNSKVLMHDVMSEQLFQGLERQRISLTEDFDQLPRHAKIKRISNVIGAKKGVESTNFDPDPTYELTADNVMKMLAIQMRFRCGIPVVIMGETGCGKTRLVRFLCALQREDRAVENMVLVKVHGGTTAEMIYRKVREAEILAEENQRTHKLDTILFFDEANTTEAIFAIKEVLCDKTLKGEPLLTGSGLKIIAACNPYRKHSPEMIQRLERAGLGYRVKADETEDRLGKVPLRQLVYRVHPLPPSMASLVWDFGQLSDLTELSYIRQIVQKTVQDHCLPTSCRDIISHVLGASQKYMRSRENECSFVSLRDVERSMKVLIWFYQHSDILFDCSNLSDADKTLKCLILSAGVCYYPSLVSKEEYLSVICRYFPDPLRSSAALQEVISSCQDFFLQNIQTRETIAKNIALKENVFLMVVCIELRIPLFLVGKPGSSKSLAKTVVADAMQGQTSHCELFKKLKQVHMVSFQCSPHSSPEGIISTFRNCARFQKDKNMDEYVSVVVLDEIGLAEDSPQMPLKTLHPLLEDGCIDNDKPDPHMKVGFVGISNWALDPAKMNRGIFVSRWDPSEDELVETAKGICASSNQILLKIKHLFPCLAKAFLRICNETSKNQFFGLRDYYSLVKMLFAAVKSTQQEPDEKHLVEAILRNFSGQPEVFDPVIYFQEVLQNITDIPRPSTLEMVKKNLDLDTNQESRYLLLLTTNNAALHILQQQIFTKGCQPTPEIVFGSGFPKDQEYAQICRNVNRVKTCMETGRTVILLNMQNLYESLYDALNQYYVYLSKQQYVDLGLGSHRVKCRVHANFRLVVVEDQKKVYEHFPMPLINRLEKHRVDRSTDLEPWQHRVLQQLKNWVQKFMGEASEDFKASDIFVGYHDDACASALLQALEMKEEKAEGSSGDLRQQEEDEPQGTSDIKVNEDDQISEAMDIESAEKEQENYSLEKNGKESDSEGKVMSDSVEIMETESVVGSTGENQEEEVFNRAKCLFLNCATPDAVLRLKYSDLSNQEIEKLQRLYFQQQHHRSLRDLLQNCLKEHQNSQTFLEITTFSSLLTRADVRDVARALGLQTDRILLLSLHQFDTEVSFCNKIRSFLQHADQSLHILVVQMDMEESNCSDELIASAKYCTMNYLMTLEDQTCVVIFVVKVSRISSQSQYIGFQGGVWCSVHIDDLRDSEDMSLNLLVFCGTLISSLLHPAASDHRGSGETTRKDSQMDTNAEGAHLHSQSLVRSCIQKAVGLLRDREGMTPRSMRRMHVLLTLLGADQDRVGAHFQEVLLARLADALARREELMYSPTEWVNREAKKRQALQEGGTLRHTLWRCLQSSVTPILAAMFEVLDRYASLDLLCGEGLSQGLKTVWMDIFGDPKVLELNALQSHSESDQEVLVQHYFMLDGEERPCAAPFSWLVRMHLDSLWEESEFVPVTSKEDMERMGQFVSSFRSSRLWEHFLKLSEQERTEYSHRYLQDFLLLTLKITSQDQLQVFCQAVLGCVSELQTAVCDEPDLLPAWIHAAAKHFAFRLDFLRHVFLLKPKLAATVLQQGSKGDKHEMVEDVLALGICAEQIRPQAVSSLHECESLVSSVEFLQPCVDRVFGQKYSALCSTGCSQQLSSIRSLWSGILVVVSFIQHVVFKVKDKDSRLREAALKHCSLNLSLIQESPDFRSVGTLQQLIRILNSFHDECISRELRFGISCPVCLGEISDPCVLPCQHVFCLSCLQRSLQPSRSCPKCRTELPANFTPTVSTTVRAALQQQVQVRHCCNAFFLDVVSRFSLSEGQQPAEGVVELLFSLLVSANGDVYRTRELSPFLQCVDSSPVVRSVLPKLLLQHSFEQVKRHIQTYLRNLEENVLKREDRSELYLLFVSCFQDSLLCSEARETDHSRQKQTEADCRFLSRIARKQTPSREEDPAEFLLCTARLRMCLSAAAQLLQTAALQGCQPVELQFRFLQQVKAVCEYSGKGWFRVYLLRALHRLSGVDSIVSLINSPSWTWIFPEELLRLQRRVPTNMDLFLCCGTPYRDLRQAVLQVLVENRSENFRREAQKLKGSKISLLALALFRQVTCRYRSPDISMRPSQQEIARIQQLLTAVKPKEFRDFCSALLLDQLTCLHVGGLGSGGPLRQTLLELLVHLDAVLLSGNVLLVPLHMIASQPHSATDFFLPTMPEDQRGEARQWLSREGRLHTYYCANGHPVFVGECGKPMVLSKCFCGSLIGGHGHVPVAGFTKDTGQSAADQTRTGHILGEARRRSEAPERQMTYAQSCILRLLMHLAMLQGAVKDLRGVSNMIHPRPPDVLSFLWSHLETDIQVLGRALDQNADNTAVTVHLILQTCTEGSRQAGIDLSSRAGRQRWEQLVCQSAINPVLQGLQRRLSEAQEMIAADDRLAGSPLMSVLFSDPGRLLSLPSDCPTQCSSFWTLPEMMTVERFSHLVGEEDDGSLTLLVTFLNKIHCVRQLRHLPELAALQSDLLRVFPVTSHSAAQTIAQVLQKIPAGPQRRRLQQRVQMFISVWNCLRAELANNSGDLGVDVNLCQVELTSESSAEFLSPGRHGPGSCLQTLLDFLLQTHNNLVREARRASKQDSEYSVPLERISETQLTLCDPERELLPLVLAHCHHTLQSGGETTSSYDLQGIQTRLIQNFLAGKPLIQADSSRVLNRHLQDFSVVLDEVRRKIPQEPLKGSVSSALRSVLRSFTDVCDAVFVLEIGLRFLGKTGGNPQRALLSFLTDSLQMEQQISSSVAKGLGESRLEHSVFTWQLLTSWKSELILLRNQDPFEKLPSQLQQKLSEEQRKVLKVFLAATDVDTFTLELHEILLLKTNNSLAPDEGYQPQWDLRTTLHVHMEQKDLPPLLDLETLPEDITVAQGADVWRAAVHFKRR